ncbi:MAG: CoA ester lyase [Alicyclobacillus sp.]|nr:CoA ester lyase [Alicyclobacillus sp.]
MSTLLFVPAGDERKFAKANELPCSGVIVDLEDAVHASKKVAARASLQDIVPKHRSAEKRLFVRMNGLDTPYWQDDAEAIAALGVDGIVVPKADQNLPALDEYLAKLERSRGWALYTIRLLLILETARAVADMEAVLRVSPRVDSAAIGMADLALDLGTSWEDLCMEEPQLLRGVREQLALVSRKLGLEAPWDSVYMKISDEAGLRADARIGKRLGFQGKHVIHPSQISVVNGVYRVSEEEYRRAKAVLERMADQGAAQIEGLLVDEPVIRRARQVVQAYEEGERR